VVVARAKLEPSLVALPDVAAESGSDLIPVDAVAQAVVGLLRTVRRAKAQMLSVDGDDVGSATQLLLRTIAADGPMRASALAANVQADLSTISRQVGTLVTQGLLERRADPEDGRACLLVLTEAGQDVLAQHEEVRAAFFEQVLAGWPAEELGQFAVLVERFDGAYQKVHAAWMRDAAARNKTNLIGSEGAIA
jgi:DNA-binding MarR family transcriptional regulator